MEEEKRPVQLKDIPVVDILRDINRNPSKLFFTPGWKDIKFRLERIDNYEELKKYVEEEIQKRGSAEGIFAYLKGEIAFMEGNLYRGRNYKSFLITESPYKRFGTETRHTKEYSFFDVDSHVNAKELMFRSPIKYSAQRAKMRVYNVYELKKLLSHFSPGGRLAFFVINESGLRDAALVAKAIDFYDEHVRRLAAIYPESRDLFHEDKDEKRDLVAREADDIIRYLVNEGEVAIWGELTDWQKKLFIDIIQKRNAPASLEMRANFIDAISNYTTVDETRKGVISSDAIERFIIK